MSENTAIEWCDHTANFWEGCTRVSEGCDTCYACTRADRFHSVDWDGPPRRTSRSTWRQPYKWNRKAAADGIRRRVFCLSIGDFFDNQVEEQWRVEAWEVIKQCPALDWLVLTKRPQNIPKMLPGGWPWPHVWLGVSVENQIEAFRRAPLLLKISATIRFISAEPLLEPVDLAPWVGPGCIDWVIAGGESDNHRPRRHRPFDQEWARHLLGQCRTAGVAFFMKQLGSDWPKHGRDPKLFDADLRVREWPR